MTILARSLKSIPAQGLEILFKIRKVLIGMIVIGLGLLLGCLFSSSRETAELTISILVILVLMLVIMNKPLNGLLAMLFFMSFIETWIKIPMGAGIPDLSFSRFAVAFLIIFMLAQAAIGKFRFASFGLVEICIIAVPLGVMISASLSEEPKSVIQEAITVHFVPLIAYFLAKNLVQNKDDFYKLLLVTAVFGFVTGAYVIYEATTGNILFLGKNEEVNSLLFRSDSGVRIIRGLLGTGGGGRVLATAIPITFYLFFERKGASRKILLMGMLAVQFFGLLLTYNRTSWYGLLISLSILQFFYPQFRKAYLVLAFISAVVLWATWDQVGESQAADRVNDESSTLEGREVRWQAGFNMWKVKPIRGWGVGRYEEESGRFRTDGMNKNFEAIESDYLDIMVSSGLLAFAPYLIFLLAPLVTSVRLFFRARAPDWAGFIKPETIALYWCIIFSFALASYTKVQNGDVAKMFPLVLAGAIVGSHEHLLRGAKTDARRRER